MKRRYTIKKAREAIEILQTAKPGGFLGADILTGFPGEEDSDHSLTISLIKEYGFSELHVFRYSPRPGTAAFSYNHRIPETVKTERSHELLALSHTLVEEYHRLWKNREVEVLLEKKIEAPAEEQETYQGLSGNYLKLIVTHIPRARAFRSNRVRCIIKEPGNPGKGKYREG
jgi:threonylcarbamoyladenosine tRNA methylthiotransferase MtaB